MILITFRRLRELFLEHEENVVRRTLKMIEQKSKEDRAYAWLLLAQGDDPQAVRSNKGKGAGEIMNCHELAEHAKAVTERNAFEFQMYTWKTKALQGREALRTANKGMRRLKTENMRLKVQLETLLHNEKARAQNAADAANAGPFFEKLFVSQADLRKEVDP